LEFKLNENVNPQGCNFINRWLTWTSPFRPGGFHPSPGFRLTLG